LEISNIATSIPQREINNENPFDKRGTGSESRKRGRWKERRTLVETHHSTTHTLISIPHSYRAEPSLRTFSMMFSRFRLHHVCETVEREVTDSIIPGRWAYIHLPPHGGFRSGQKLSASCTTTLFRLSVALVSILPSLASLFVCEKTHGSTCSPSRWRP